MENIIGKKIEKLFVEEYVGSDKIKGKLYLCLCDCGMDRVLSKSQLYYYKSCGCMKSRNGSKKHPEYTVWRKMKERCYNKNQDSYPYYGGRGIEVCDRWKNSFESFLYDMGKRPSDKYQLDRKDNDGNYSPENCRWATRSENIVNRPSKLEGLKNIQERTNGKYRVSITRNNIRYQSYQVDSIKEAINIRDRMLKEYEETKSITIFK